MPGLGAKPSNAPLPGLGNKPSNAPLPGLGGTPAGGGLPGLGTPGQPAVVPPFMQQQQQQAQQPTHDESRDPFAKVARPPTRASSIPPGMGLIDETRDPSVKFSTADAGGSRKPLLIGAAIVGFVALLIGFLAGKAISGRVELNIAIRDALIVEYEIKKAAKLFDEVQTVIGTAVTKAKGRSFDMAHLTFLNQKVKGNPIPAQIFTQRNYKKFAPEVVQWLNDYYNKWAKLDKLIQAHRMETKNDKSVLTASKAQFQKLLMTNYGVVFTRDKQKNFMANVVILGNSEEKKGKTMVQVQVRAGTFGDERELLNPPRNGNQRKLRTASMQARTTLWCSWATNPKPACSKTPPSPILRATPNAWAK